jgi:hypothetical protein
LFSASNNSLELIVTTPITLLFNPIFAKLAIINPMLCNFRYQ